MCAIQAEVQRARTIERMQRSWPSGSGHFLVPPVLLAILCQKGKKRKTVLETPRLLTGSRNNLSQECAVLRETKLRGCSTLFDECPHCVILHQVNMLAKRMSVSSRHSFRLVGFLVLFWRVEMISADFSCHEKEAWRILCSDCDWQLQCVFSPQKRLPGENFAALTPGSIFIIVVTL